mmetsp:Transcript_33355/g.72150  ORF Transcript_33355/g.72150 Transcript_33355/m.72150 type:complete len:265 (-) Transcript_33355:457-1251(-)
MDEPPAKRAKTLSVPPPQALISWYDLSPELIVRMSKYVNIGHDMTGLCVVVGSDIAARIRRAYLADNDEYLAHALSLVRGRAGAAAAARKVRFWMAVNSNWRNRCDKLSFESVEWAYRDNDSTLSQLQPKESIGRVVMFNEDGPRALAVSFTDGAARHSVTVPVRSIFTSPMIATRLGLVEVVKTLIDKGFLAFMISCHPERMGAITVYLSLVRACETKASTILFSGICCLEMILISTRHGVKIVPMIRHFISRHNQSMQTQRR